MTLFWSPAARRFVCVTKSFQPVVKHIVDHGRETTNASGTVLHDRRILTIRTSPDGRNWEPAASVIDRWKDNGRRVPTQAEDDYVKVPDSDDPPDLEFYSGAGFSYHDRVYMMVLNYVASPELRGTTRALPR